MDSSPDSTNFRALSLKDLLEARDLYHWHLVNKANVVGTAVGLYLIRSTDPEPDRRSKAVRRSRTRSREKEARRLDNTEVRDYSWPCILVLVREWVHREDFRSDKLASSHYVPSTIYLPDGRTVPVCVVEAPPLPAARAPLARLAWPDNRLGGGMPLVASVQGRDHVASVGCLVTDGHKTYALTNRHVCGPEGSVVSTQLRGRSVPIGKAASLQLSRKMVRDVYPEFPGRRTFVNLDVGLVEVDDVNDWTSQVYGLGPIAKMADLNEKNLNLSLIDAPVVAHGAASGLLKGKVKALFYRYKSVGGFDYVCDFLIGPRHEQVAAAQTLPGDSGTLWHLADDQDRAVEALAIQWGGQTLAAGPGAAPLAFALATNLSSACRLLDVELVTEHNTGYAPYWGVTGHYSIASFACDAITSPKLRKLMSTNVDRISYRLGELDPQAMAEAMRDSKKDGSFVPLADVPDVIWKQFHKSVRGGRDPQPRSGPEHPTHYADIDEENDGGKSLRELSLRNGGKNLTVSYWQDFYTTLGHTDSRSRGLLPFRVQQFYREMVARAADGDVAGFVAAAGIVSHYVGDACQPLHGSVLADGYKDQAEEVVYTKRDGTQARKQQWPGEGVHSAYESNMIDRKVEDLIALIEAKMSASTAALARIEDGPSAALEALRLMDRAARLLPPSEIVDAYIELGGGQSRAVLDGLWEQFGDRTARTMADGARVLAAIWQGAWVAGGGNQIADSKLKAIDKDTLQSLYEDPGFVPSVDLDGIAEHL